VTACDVTTFSQENDDLLDFRPREATYNPLTKWTRLRTGGQIRNYENIKSNCCVGTPLSLSASGEAEVYGSWLGTDCVHSLRLHSYIDYHTFTVYQTANFIIDLEYQGDVVDTYLYQVVGGVESLLDLNDDIDYFTNSRISRSLDPGTYKIGASTYDTGKTGDYRLRIRQAPYLPYRRQAQRSTSTRHGPRRLAYLLDDPGVMPITTVSRSMVCTPHR
jgi:hypothetical protein